MMFTYELARRLHGSGVTATVLHPGVVRTAFGAEDQSVLFKVMLPLIRPFLKTAAQGAATMLQVSTFRLYALRAMYVFMFVGLALVKWPAIRNPRPARRMRALLP